MNINFSNLFFLQKTSADSKHNSDPILRAKNTFSLAKDTVSFGQIIFPCPGLEFLHDRELSIDEKLKRIEESQNIVELGELAESLGIKKENLRPWIKYDKLTSARLLDGWKTLGEYINIESEQSKAFFESIKEKLPTSVSGEQRLLKLNQMFSQIGMSPKKAAQCISSIKLKPLGFEDTKIGLSKEGFLYDMNNPENKAGLEKLETSFYIYKQQQAVGTAFLHAKDLSISGKLELVNNSPNIRSVSSLADMLNIDIESLNVWISNGKLITDKFPESAFHTWRNQQNSSGVPVDQGQANDTSTILRRKYIDVENEVNKKFLDGIKEKLPSSRTIDEIAEDWTSSPSWSSHISFRDKESLEFQLKDSVRTGKLHPLGCASVDGNNTKGYLFDLKDGKNKAKLDEIKKAFEQRFYGKVILSPIPKSKYFTRQAIPAFADDPDKRKFVRLKNLENLGYGNRDSIKQAIREGRLPKRVEKTDKVSAEGKPITVTSVDINDPNVKNVLLSLKESNDFSVRSMEQICDELSVKKGEVIQWVNEGKLKMLEYVYPEETNNVRFLITDAKNSEFLGEKMAEAFTEAVIDVQSTNDNKRFENKASFIRTKLAWLNCEKTKSVMHERAARDGYISSLIAKKENEGKGALTKKENIAVLAYLKGSWAEPGAREAFREAMTIAKQIMEEVKENGIDSIENEDVRKIYEEADEIYGSDI